jgi:hypothetical protein
MKKCHHLRALALLGALILYFLLWPICCCAAKPVQLIEDKSKSNQTYQDLMTAPGISDNMGTNKDIVDLFNTPISHSNGTNKGTNVHNTTIDTHRLTVTDSESFESMTTSIYELFNLSSGKRKFVGSSNQVLSRTDRSVHLNSSNSKNNSVSGAKRVKNNKTKSSTLERNERSANLSHITGSARKIQLYIKNRFLQLLPDGTVNGTTDDLSDYSKFIRF